MKRFIVVTVLFMAVSTQAFDWSITALSKMNNPDQYAFAAGKIFKNQWEIGGHFLFSNPEESDHAYSLAAGPYIAGDIPVPDAISLPDYRLYGGLALPYHFQDHTLIWDPFVAGLLYPERNISPVVVVEYKYSSEDIQRVESGLQYWLGLRVQF